MPTTAPSSPVPARRKRVRLSPDVRSRQILDAALVEFSQHGFVGTRIDDIARRAGLSKSGVYAHFGSKEQIFETLLTATLIASEPAPEPLPVDLAPACARARVEAFIDEIYERLTNPRAMAMMRLLVSEGVRFPELVRTWRDTELLPQQRRKQAELATLIGSERLRGSVLAEDLSLLVAPALMAMFKQMTFGDEQLEAMKAMNKRMALQLLRLDEPPDGRVSAGLGR